MSRHPRAGGGTDKGFLGRWSDRKIRDREAGETPDPESMDLSEDLETGTNAPEQRDGKQSVAEETKVEPVKTDDDMPDLETIDERTDMSDFFSPGVSEQLRNLALRRLWRLPKFNVVDVMDDYNEDFRNFELLGDIVTADMRHRSEMEEQRRREVTGIDDATESEEMESIDHIEDSDHDEQQEDRVAEQTEPVRKLEEPESAETDTPGTDPQPPRA